MRFLRFLTERRTVTAIVNWAMVTLALCIGLWVTVLGRDRYRAINRRQSCISRPHESLPAKIFRVLFVPDKIDRDRDAVNPKRKGVKQPK